MFSILLLAAIVGLGASQLSISNCPFGLARDDNLQAFGTNCFRFELTHARDYSDAEKDCEKVAGGTLAMPKTKDVDDFLVKQLKDTYAFKKPVWIGLNDVEIENDFVWADGEQFNKTHYTNFARFEGLGADITLRDWEDCVAIHPVEDEKWHDYHCDSAFSGLVNEEKHYICQYGMIPKPCPDIVCMLNCGMEGLMTDNNNCMICKCDM